MDERTDRSKLNREPVEVLEAPRRRIQRGKIDLPFLLLVLLLLAVGLVMLLSASYVSAYYETDAANPAYYFKRQLFLGAGGLVALWLASKVPMRWYQLFAVPFLILSGILLVITKLLGIAGGGAVRWISIGGITIQPSELLKAALVLTFALWISKRGAESLRTFRGALPYLLVLGVATVLLIAQPHLSATIIILCIGAIMLYAGGMRNVWFLIAIAAAAIGIVVLRQNAEWVQHMAEEHYQFARIAAWLDPEAQKLGDGWQIVQSLYAIGSGGLLGLGLGQSYQKYLYLPEEQNDYIFSIVCEELGFIGAALILLLFAVLVLRGFWLALRCPDRFGSLVILGLTALISLQVFLNVGVATNLLPSTGISLPFFSYGGSALIVQLGEVGILLNATRDIPDK